MMKNLQKDEIDIAVTVDIRDTDGSKFGVHRNHVSTGINRHSHIGSVLAETIIALEQGDPEGFCRIMVATLGSGRRILADVMKSDTISTSVLKRFATIMEEAEIMNEDDEDEDDGTNENGFQRGISI